MSVVSTWREAPRPLRVNAHVRRQVAGSARRPGARAQAARQAAGSACVAVREIRTPAGRNLTRQLPQRMPSPVRTGTEKLLPV